MAHPLDPGAHNEHKGHVGKQIASDECGETDLDDAG
jgi:hypothetical protein